jgi:hypothetical protein
MANFNETDYKNTPVLNDILQQKKMIPLSLYTKDEATEVLFDAGHEDTSFDEFNMSAIDRDEHGLYTPAELEQGLRFLHFSEAPGEGYLKKEAVKAGLSKTEFEALDQRLDMNRIAATSLQEDWALEGDNSPQSNGAIGNEYKRKLNAVVGSLTALDDQPNSEALKAYALKQLVRTGIMPQFVEEAQGPSFFKQVHVKKNLRDDGKDVFMTSESYHEIKKDETGSLNFERVDLTLTAAERKAVQKHLESGDLVDLGKNGLGKVMQMKTPESYRNPKQPASFEKPRLENLEKSLESPAMIEQFKQIEKALPEIVKNKDTQQLQTLLEPIKDEIVKAYGIKDVPLSVVNQDTTWTAAYLHTSKKVEMNLNALEEKQYLTPEEIDKYQSNPEMLDKIQSARLVGILSHELMHAANNQVIENPQSFGYSQNDPWIKDLKTNNQYPIVAEENTPLIGKAKAAQAYLNQPSEKQVVSYEMLAEKTVAKHLGLPKDHKTDAEQESARWGS